jgi:hypothetical protein
MENEPTVRLDPDRLKRERADVDLGADHETDHHHLDREPGHGPRGEADDSLAQPSAGATPPAR